MTPRLCVIGDPVEQSLSPAIQNAMMKALGVAGRYGRARVSREELPAFLERVRAGEYTGFNATMPLKTDLVALVDELDPAARAVEAVNTVARLPDGRLKGYNTDGDGFVEAARRMGYDPIGAEICLLGTGGAARSVGAALAKADAGQITVFGRDQAATRNILQAMGRVAGPHVAIRSERFAPDLPLCAAERVRMLVNCTNLGMAGMEQFHSFDFLDELPWFAAVCDVVYHPRETELLRRARERGLRTMNGLPMLVWQGVLALEKFLGGQNLNREKMAMAAFAALGERGTL